MPTSTQDSADTVRTRKVSNRVTDRMLSALELPERGARIHYDQVVAGFGVRIRAGKRHLKDNWGIRSWSDLDTKFGDLVIEATDVVRLTMQREDRNRARWPNDPIWNVVRQELSADLFEMRNFAPPDTIKRIQKEKHLELLGQQLLGLLITRAAISGVSIDDLSAYAGTEGKRLARSIASDLEKTELKLSKSAARYEAIS